MNGGAGMTGGAGMNGMDVRQATPDRLDELTELFDSAGITRGCFCMYFLVPRKEFEAGWRGGGNQAAFKALTTDGGVPLGLIAYREDRPVGWVAVGPRSRFKTAIGPRARVLKGRDPAEDDDVWLIPCFFVRAGARGLGTTRALLDAAVAFAQAGGAKAVEGFPLSEGAKLGADGYLGHEPVFRAAGFSVVHRPNDRRVVMRRDLP
jgi:GNAT superfamily N-acetyltransferase